MRCFFLQRDREKERERQLLQVFFFCFALDNEADMHKRLELHSQARIDHSFFCAMSISYSAKTHLLFLLTNEMREIAKKYKRAAGFYYFSALRSPILH